MANQEDIALMAHLMRRAGFGATRGELENLVEVGYENVVEQLLHPEDQPDLDMYPLYRYLPQAEGSWIYMHVQTDWLYRMRNGHRPLQEKMALFWHHVFATGASKVGPSYQMAAQVDLFREKGLGNYRELLGEIARNPAMIFWLDNQDNHKRAPNENWGRELLELFSLGVGNYTEKDVYECSRAFTGWTFKNSMVSVRWGQFFWEFEYRPEDHDNGEKTFLGHTGRLNGEDIMDIIVQQPACSRFIARHLYNFFVAEEPQVPAWSIDPPGDPEAVDHLSKTLVDSGFDVKPVLRTLFNSDFFKEARYRKVKNPAEILVGTLKLTGDLQGADVRWGTIPLEGQYMGQDLLNPPSVEGWHTGKEWINSGALMNRVNFVADYVRKTDLPGIQDIIKRITASADSNGKAITAEALVDRCLELMGPMQVADSTYQSLVRDAGSNGGLSWATDEEYAAFSKSVGDTMALIAGTREYQFE